MQFAAYCHTPEVQSWVHIKVVRAVDLVPSMARALEDAASGAGALGSGGGHGTAGRSGGDGGGGGGLFGFGRKRNVSASGMSVATDVRRRPNAFVRVYLGERRELASFTQNQQPPQTHVVGNTSGPDWDKAHVQRWQRSTGEHAGTYSNELVLPIFKPRKKHQGGMGATGLRGRGGLGDDAAHDDEDTFDLLGVMPKLPPIRVCVYDDNRLTHPDLVGEVRLSPLARQWQWLVLLFLAFYYYFY